MASNVEIAKHLDITPDWVSKLKGQNILPHTPGKQMDMDQCRLAYINYLRNKARLTRDTDNGTITEHKSRLTQAQADKAEMEVQVLSSTLIRADEVRTAWTQFVANVRAKLLNLPAKMAHQVVGLDHYGEAEELLTNEIYEALNELTEVKYEEPIELGMDRNGKDVPTAKEATG